VTSLSWWSGGDLGLKPTKLPPEEVTDLLQDLRVVNRFAMKIWGLSWRHSGQTRLTVLTFHDTAEQLPQTDNRA